MCYCELGSNVGSRLDLFLCAFWCYGRLPSDHRGGSKSREAVSFGYLVLMLHVSMCYIDLPM